MFNSLIIVLTRKCNWNCSYCSVWKKDFSTFWEWLKEDELDIVVDNIINIVKNKKLDGVRFFGWEVFLKKNILVNIIKLLRNKWFDKDIYVNTNLLLFKKNDIDWVKKYNIKVITSLNWYDEIHCKTRNISKNQFNLLIDNIKFLISNWVYVQINMVIFPYKYDILKNVSFVFSLKPTKVNLLPLSYNKELLEQKNIYGFQKNIFKLFLFVKKYKLFNYLLLNDKKADFYKWRKNFSLFVNDFVIDVDWNIYYNNPFREAPGQTVRYLPENRDENKMSGLNLTCQPKSATSH